MVGFNCMFAWVFSLPALYVAFEMVFGRFVDSVELKCREAREQLQLQNVRIAERSRAYKRNYVKTTCTVLVKQKLGFTK